MRDVTARWPDTVKAGLVVHEYMRGERIPASYNYHSPYPEDIETCISEIARGAPKSRYLAERGMYIVTTDRRYLVTAGIQRNELGEVAP